MGFFLPSNLLAFECITHNSKPNGIIFQHSSPDSLSLQTAKWSRKLASIPGYDVEIEHTQIKQQTTTNVLPIILKLRGFYSNIARLTLSLTSSCQVIQKIGIHPGL